MSKLRDRNTSIIYTKESETYHNKTKHNRFSEIPEWKLPVNNCCSQTAELGMRWSFLVGVLQTYKIDNMDINTNFAFLYICNLMAHYDISKCEIRYQKRIAFQGCRLRWCSTFLMTNLKRIWQYWPSCAVQSFWKPFLLYLFILPQLLFISSYLLVVNVV